MADNTILLFDKLAKTFTDKYRALLAAHDYASMQSMPPITMGGFTIRQARDDYTQAILQGGTFNIPYYITDSSGRTVRTGEGQAPFPSDIVGGTSDYDDLTDKPSINSVILSGNKTSSDLSLASATHSHTKSEITDFPSLATVATTGDYDDLSDKPSIPTKTSDLNNDSGFINTETDPVFTASDAYGITSSDISNWNGKSDFSGSYNDLTDKPTIPVKNIWYATCSTGASTTAKTATSSTADFTLSTGNMVRVLFTNTNTATSPTISIDGSTAKNIRIRSGSTGAMTYMWRDNEVLDLVYDGTNFVISDGAIATTTYYGITVLSSSTSSTSETEAATPKAVKTAYDLANGKADAVHTHTKSDITDFPSLATVATTGDYDDLTDKPTIPTKVSDLNNDSGFISSETDPVFTASDAYGISSSDITAWNGKSTVSINRKTSSGTNIADITIDGTTTQLYAPSGGGGTSDYDSLSNRPQINSTTLTGNKSSSDLGLADASHSHTKSQITDFPTIPTKTSDLNNDSGFITSESVTDVQIGGTSIVSSTVATIPEYVPCTSLLRGETGLVPASDAGDDYNVFTGRGSFLAVALDKTNATIGLMVGDSVESTVTLTASDVGALPTSGGTLTGSLAIENHSSAIGTVKQSYASAKSVSTGTNTNLTSISLEAGTWVLTGGVRFPNNSTGYRRMNIGTSSASSWADVQLPALSGASTQLAYTVVVSPTSTKTYYLNCFHNAGTSLSLAAGGSENGINFLRAVRIA